MCKEWIKKYPVSQIAWETFGLQVSQKCGLASETMLLENSVSIKTSNSPSRSACHIFHDFLQPLTTYDRTSSAYFLFFSNTSIGNIWQKKTRVKRRKCTKLTLLDLQKGWVRTMSRKTDWSLISCHRGTCAWWSDHRSRIPRLAGEWVPSRTGPKLPKLCRKQ